MRLPLHCRAIQTQSRVLGYSTLVALAMSGLPAVFAQDAQPLPATVMAEGIQLLRAGQAEQAKERFDAAIKVAPTSPEALTWRGITENQLEQYEAAEWDFESALKVSPSLLAAHYNLALCLIRLNKIDAALKQLQIVVTAQPNSTQTRYNLAVLLEGKGLWKEAAEQLTASRRMNPADAGVALHLLQDEVRLKDFAQLSSLVVSLSAPGTPPEMQRAAANALIEAGRFPEAISLLESRPEDSRNEDEVYLLGLAHEEEKDFTRATTEFERAAQLAPQDARPFYQLGLLLAASSEGRGKATDALRSALKLDPENKNYALALARVLLVNDQAEGAYELLARTPATGDGAADFNLLMGVALAATHRQKDAIAPLRKAIALDPSLSLAYNVMGFCLFQQGQYADAADAYGRASQLEPRRQLYARDAALAYQRENQPARALEFAEKASALGQSDASDHLMLGKLYVSAHRYEDAVRELLRAAALNPDLDSADYLLARTYMQMGDSVKAAVWSGRFAELKQKHEADSAQAAPSSSIHASALLTGGSLASDDAGAP